MLARLLLGVAVALTLLATAPAAWADDAREQSRAAFMRGVAHVHQGDYVGARDSFLEAYRLFAHPSILLNLGIARWHTGEYVAAEQDLVHFLSDDGGAPPEDISSARAALAAVRAHLGTLRVRVEPEGARAAVDSQPVALVPGGFVEVRCAIGAHTVHLEADGHAPVDRGVSVARDATETIDVTLPPLPSAKATGPAGAAGVEEPAPARSRRRTLLGWSLVSVGAVAAGVGAVAGLEAMSYASDYNTRGSSGFQQPDTKSTGILFRTTADVAFVSAVVFGAAGAYLLLGPPKGWPSQLADHLFVGPSFAALRGSF